MIEQHYAGVTLDFLDTVPDYPPADGWTLKYRLAPILSTLGQSPIDIIATTSGTSYRVQQAASITAGWKAGNYTWVRWVEKAGPIVQDLGTGQIQILPEIRTLPAGYDSRSHARKMLESIEAVIESRASSTQREMVEYTIGTRGQKFDPTESKAALVELHSKYMWLVANEDARAQIAAGLPNPRDVRLRFGGR